MKKIAVITDSNSGITQSQAKELGIIVLPMPFDIDGEQYLEDITLTQEQFYEKLEGDCKISTSQPAPADVLQLWDEVLESYDEIVHIPMSSGLSGTCETAMMLAQDYDGKVQIVNNQRISLTQRQAAIDALELVAKGKSAVEIKQILEEQKMESSIYIMVDTLKYLKRGGRITPAAAALGTLLKLKPVLQIQGEKLDAFAKARTVKQAKNMMITQMKKDVENRFAGHQVHLGMAYTPGENREDFLKEIQAAFPGQEIEIAPLSLSVACHIGPGALAITCSREIVE